MVNTEYSRSDHKSSGISIGEVTENLEMLKFVPDHVKTKQICNQAIKKLFFVIRYDQY